MLNNELSVIMPNYNHGKYIGHAIEAIVTQSVQPFEIIIIDDASKDNSVKVIESFAQRYSSIKFYRNSKNMGIYYTLKKAIDIASGKYIAPAAADDIILPGYYEKTLRLLAQYPEAGLCSGISLKIDENGKTIGSIPTAVISNKNIYLPPEKVPLYLDRYGSWINGNTTVYRRDYILEFGGFRSNLLSYTDGFLQLIIALKYGVCFVPEPLSFWRETLGGISMDTAGNVDKTRFVINNTINLMQSNAMSEFFSEIFIKKWKKRRHFWIGDALAKRNKFQHQQIINEIDQLYADKTLLGKAFKLFSSFLNIIDSNLIFLYFVMKNYHNAFFNVFMNRNIFNFKNKLKTVIKVFS